MSQNPRGLTVAQAAYRAGISRAAMYRLLQARVVAYSWPRGGCIRIEERSLDRFVERSRFIESKRGGARRRGERAVARPSAGLASRALREIEAEQASERRREAGCAEAELGIR